MAYRRISETVSKNGRCHRGYPGFFSMLFPDFVISGHQTGFFCKLFPAEFHEYLPIFSQKRGMTHRLFRKLFPISDTRILDPVSFKLEYLYHV